MLDEPQKPIRVGNGCKSIESALDAIFKKFSANEAITLLFANLG